MEAIDHEQEIQRKSILNEFAQFKIKNIDDIIGDYNYFGGALDNIIVKFSMVTFKDYEFLKNLQGSSSQFVKFACQNLNIYTEGFVMFTNYYNLSE